MPLNTDEDEEDAWEDEEDEEPKNEKVVKRDVAVKPKAVAEKPTKKVAEQHDSTEYELAQVPTQHTLAIRNKDTGDLMSVEEGIVQILNLLSKIEKVVG